MSADQLGRGLSPRQREYALMSGGSIVNVVTTSRSIEEVREMFSDREVKPMDEVPLSVKQRYEFWDVRP